MHWKSIVYLMAAIQVGAGSIIIGVLSFIPLFIQDLGITDPGTAATWAGIVSGVTPLMVAISAPFWSRKANQHGPKYMLAAILFTLGLANLAAFFVQSPWQLLACRIVQGLVGGFVPIGLLTVTWVSPEEKLPWGMGFYQAAMVMGLVIGPLLGGLVADSFGYRAPFLFFALVAFLCLLALLAIMPKIPGKGAVAAGDSMISNLKYFMSIKEVRLLVGMQFLCNFGLTGIGPILPLYIKHYMSVDAGLVATIVGIIMFLAGITSASSSLMVGKLTERFPMKRLLIVATVGVGATFVLQYAMWNIWGLGFFRGFTGVFMGLVMPIANTLISQAVIPDKRGLVFGAVSSVVMMG
ncbi:MAG: MFS transporter, partial [Veillonella sp.]|nr:MFS transporter [Veillonella sp.]